MPMRTPMSSKRGRPNGRGAPSAPPTVLATGTGCTLVVGSRLASDRLGEDKEEAAWMGDRVLGFKRTDRLVAGDERV